jgi:hypothetical protein
MTMPLYDFLSGAVATGFLVCCLFFLRYWRRTGDSLFIYFALAFALLGFGEGMFTLANVQSEHRVTIFLIRLAAFGIIIFAIARTNRRRA